MKLEKVKKLLRFIQNTPLHPQWLILRHESNSLKNICQKANGRILDIGCAEKKPLNHLPANSNYIGLDYYFTAQNLYMTKPDIFGDAQNLPIASNSIDTVLLLDVLEHLPYPEQCIGEISRTLKKNGKLWIQVPFMYPIHDAPLDFHRWTEYGLKNLASKHELSIEEKHYFGKPLETASLIINIATCKTVLNWIEKKHPLSITAMLLPFTIPLINTIGWLSFKLSSPDDMMPLGYYMLWTKN